MKKIMLAVLLSVVVGGAPLLAQEKKDMPMKGEMPIKGEGMKGGGMMMGNMREMHGKMMEMKKGMGGMMQGKGMMKSEDIKGMGGTMGDMSDMMKQMSERMGRGMKKTQ
jgi:hypothetical protein